MRSQQRWLEEKCASGCECAEWMNAGCDLSAPESSSPPFLLSLDGCSLYVKQTQPFHSAAPIAPLCSGLGSKDPRFPEQPDSHKLTARCCFIEAWAGNLLHVRDSYCKVKSSSGCGEGRKSWLKTKGWFAVSWLREYLAGIHHWLWFWQHIILSLQLNICKVEFLWGVIGGWWNLNGYLTAPRSPCYISF